MQDSKSGQELSLQPAYTCTQVQLSFTTAFGKTVSCFKKLSDIKYHNIGDLNQQEYTFMLPLSPVLSVF